MWLKKTTYDFKDGNGEVPAARHKNINGLTGGWVAATATVESTAYIGENAVVFDNTRVYSNAEVSDYARISGNASVYGYARVFGYGQIFGNAIVSGDASVSGNAQVYGNARVYGDAKVYGYTVVYGGAVICENMKVSFSRVISDLTKRENLQENIKAQTGLVTFDEFVYCFKQVAPSMSSLHDPDFFYKLHEYVEAVDPDISNTSCASGLHFSNATYWEQNAPKGSIYLMCKVALDDIITVQDGKIRAKKCFVVDKTK